MEETHYLNEELQRLEPTETFCSFCEKAISTNMEENYFCPVFKEKDRTNIVIYRSVNFDKIDFGIPRCSRCYAAHVSNLKYGRTVAVIIAISIGALIFALLGLFVIFYIALIPIIVLFVPRLIADWKTEKQNIKTEKQGAIKDDSIQDLIRGGWTLKQPNA